MEFELLRKTNRPKWLRMTGDEHIVSGRSPSTMPRTAYGLVSIHYLGTSSHSVPSASDIGRHYVGHFAKLADGLKCFKSSQEFEYRYDPDDSS